jgi:hypothetical protein
MTACAPTNTFGSILHAHPGSPRAKKYPADLISNRTIPRRLMMTPAADLAYFFFLVDFFLVDFFAPYFFLALASQEARLPLLCLNFLRQAFNAFCSC